MTHDEILEKIKTHSGICNCSNKALLAVVELEKVVPSFNIDKELYTLPIDTALQIAYANGFIESREKVIQAIEKELS